MITKVQLLETGAARNLKPEKVLSILKKNLKLLGNEWYESYFKRFKFSPVAQNKYHLVERQKWYIKKMKREHGSWAPFQATGKLRQAALAGANIKPNYRAADMDVVIKIRRGHPTKKWVSMELISVLKQEIKQLMSYFMNKTEQEIKGK